MLSGSDLPRAFSRDKCCSWSYRFAPWKWCQLSSSFAFSWEARAKHWALHFLLLARVWLPHLQRVVTVGFEFNEKFIVWENQWDQCIGRKTFHKVPSTKNTWKNVVISTIFFGTKGGGYTCFFLGDSIRDSKFGVESPKKKVESLIIFKKIVREFFVCFMKMVLDVFFGFS